MDATPLNMKTAEAFAERMVDILNSASLALMTSIGHRTGLFDAMARMAPETSQGIAERARLDERYVREWLGAMVTGGIVDYRAEARTYHLRPEHAACLTRDATPDNLAAFTQYVAMLGSVEDPIVECFRNGGGVPYSAFERFHQIMAEDSGQTVLGTLIDQILPLVPGLIDRLDAGIEVLDVGCGSGRALNLMARAFPRSRFLGYDLCEEAVSKARDEARAHGSKNVLFLQKDMTEFDEPGQFDLITAFDAIHDQARPDLVLRGICRALRRGGTFLMQDIAASSHVEKNLDHPIGPFIYTISTMHCMTVSLAQGGAGLGTAWGRELAERMLGDAGFEDVRIRSLAHDFQNDYYVASKS